MYISKNSLYLSMIGCIFLLTNNVLQGIWIGADYDPQCYEIDYLSPNGKLIRAANLGSIELAEEALKENANLDYKHRGRTALEWAQYYEYEELVDYLEYHLKRELRARRIAALETKYADFIEDENFSGKDLLGKPLITALYYNSASDLATLLATGTSPREHVGHRYNSKPVAHYAAFFGRVGCLRLLLDHGASINKRDFRKNTLLHAALKGAAQETDQAGRSLPIIETLLRAGAQVRLVNLDEETTLDLARRTKNAQIIALIEKAYSIQRYSLGQIEANRKLRAKPAYQENLFKHIVIPACKKYELINDVEATQLLKRAELYNEYPLDTVKIPTPTSKKDTPATTSQHAQAFDFTRRIIEERKKNNQLQLSPLAIPAATATTTTALYQLARLLGRAPATGRARLVSMIAGGGFGALAQRYYHAEINAMHGDYLAARTLPYVDRSRNGFIGGQEYYQEHEPLNSPSRTTRNFFLRSGGLVHALLSFGASNNN